MQKVFNKLMDYVHRRRLSKFWDVWRWNSERQRKCVTTCYAVTVFLEVLEVRQRQRCVAPKVLDSAPELRLWSNKGNEIKINSYSDTGGTDCSHSKLYRCRRRTLTWVEVDVADRVMSAAYCSRGVITSSRSARLDDRHLTCSHVAE